MKNPTAFILLFLSLVFTGTSAGNTDIPLQIRMIRIFGGDNEKEPPVIVLNSPDANIQSSVGSAFVTIEFDIQASVPPGMYAKFVHCSVDWNENENIFLNDLIYSRTSNIEWASAPASSGYYSYRGKLTAPNVQVKFKYAGNWKVKLYDYANDSIPLAEARFFVLMPKAKADLRVIGDFYDPKYNFIAPSAVTLEAIVYADQKLFDNQLNTVVFYRNQRWFEPYFVSQDIDIAKNNKIHKYYFQTMAGGFASAGKIFRIAGIPSENEYRLLNLSNIGYYPAVNNVVRTPLSDYRRRGDFFDNDDDGAMITKYIADYYDDYVNMEFTLDPDNWISAEDVYVSGSFNNWKPDKSWQMYYDSNSRYYKLRQLIRRARHNYMYGTGKYNATNGQVEKISYDEFEGNTSINSHTYLAFVYYREFDFGGYDALIGISAAGAYGNIRR